MNILTILGSPKKKGNTSRVLQYFEKAARKKGHHVARINLIDHTIGLCRECHACTKITEKPGCVQRDDVQTIFDKMFDADEIVYASPLIGWDVSSLMKTFMDRHYSIVKGFVGAPVHKSFIDGKSISLLMSCMGPIENNCDLVQVFFDRFGSHVKAGRVRKYVVPKSIAPDFADRAQEGAIKMAKEIIA